MARILAVDDSSMLDDATGEQAAFEPVALAALHPVDPLVLRILRMTKKDMCLTAHTIRRKATTMGLRGIP